MSKFASFAAYPKRSLAGAEAALLTVWASLSRYHDNLVLVGGLAVKYLTKPGAGLLPGPVTMDVDLGVTLATEGGQYGTTADDLTGQGFKRDKNGRYVRQFEAMPVFIELSNGAPHGHQGYGVGGRCPRRCAAFALEGKAGMDDFQSRQRQITEQMVTAGRALLGTT